MYVHTSNGVTRQVIWPKITTEQPKERQWKGREYVDIGVKGRLVSGSRSSSSSSSSSSAAVCVTVQPLEKASDGPDQQAISAVDGGWWPLAADRADTADWLWLTADRWPLAADRADTADWLWLTADRWPLAADRADTADWLWLTADRWPLAADGWVFAS